MNKGQILSSIHQNTDLFCEKLCGQTLALTCQESCFSLFKNSQTEQNTFPTHETQTKQPLSERTSQPQRKMSTASTKLKRNSMSTFKFANTCSMKPKQSETSTLRQRKGRARPLPSRDSCHVIT